MIKKIVIIMLIVFIPIFVQSATKYVSPTGSGSTCAIGSPCSISYAIANAVAGETWLFRAGTYNITTIATAHAGSGDADNQRIIFKAYTGETPDIVATQSDYSCISIRHNYWTFDGLTMHGATTRTEAGVIGTDEGYEVTGTKIINNHIHHTGASTFDNVDAIILHTAYNSLVQNNDIEGWSTSQNGGIILFNGTGNKILSNYIHGGAQGIYQKHPNYDSSLASGAEWAYNYITCGSTCIGSCGAYINIHDNIAVSSGGKAFRWGENAGGGGGIQGMAVTHNTVKGDVYIVADWGMPNATVKNNIMTGGIECYGCTMGTWTYDLLGWSQSGSNNINGAPTFTGGATPSTVAGYALTAQSLGYGNSDDSKDRGADTTLVYNYSDEATPVTSTYSGSGTMNLH